jgi:hypothetical protein
VPIETTFTGKAGQKVRVEVEAQRLGSKLRPVVHLTSPKKVEVGWAWPNPGLGGDTRLEATLPSDGVYTISLHDVEYAGANPGFFRMRVGQWDSVDLVYPPVVGKNKQAVELIGTGSLATVEATAAPGANFVPLPWPAGGTWSGPRPFVRVSPLTEIVEQPTSAKGQDVPEGPVAVSGRLSAPFEEDRYVVPVKAGQKLKLEVLSERIGSPLDVALVIRNSAGAEIGRAEDGPNTLDPILDYTVPANTASIIVGVVDSQGRGGPRGIYRLLITPQTTATNKTGFQLLTTAQRLTVPAGGSAVYHVGIERGGYAGALELAADGLPAGITLEGNTIPAGTDGTLVTLRRADAAAEAGVVTWRGKAEDGTTHGLLVKGHPLERLQPWLAHEVAVAPSKEKATAFQIDWKNLPPTAGLSPAGKLTLPFQVTRPLPTPLLDKNPVRVTLLTSQFGALAPTPPDPNTQLRLEKAIELPFSDPGEAVVIVPPTLNAPVYDVTLKAELLTPDKTRVLATSFAPVRRMSLKLPLAVAVDGGPRVTTKLDPKTGAMVEVKGSIQRLEGATGDVQVTLTGVPPGVPAPPVTTVKADATTFAIKLTIPPTVPPGETALKLSGTIAPDPKQPNVRVKSRDVELTLAVQ